MSGPTTVAGVRPVTSRVATVDTVRRVAEAEGAAAEAMAQRFSRTLQSHRPPATGAGTGPSSDLADRAAAATQTAVTASRELSAMIDLASSGQRLCAADLIALQARVFRCARVVETFGKVVETSSSAVRETLRTQV